MKTETENQLLLLQNICYDVEKTKILDDISFNINESDFLSIVGPNGSGKTTLLKLILGIKKQNKGKILYQNSADNKKISVGYVPQTKTLDKFFPAIALELVLNGISKTWHFKTSKTQKEKAMEILEKLNAAHLAKKQLNNLSGGELQRIYLARAIIRNPKLLLLDEPATGIDMVCENDINSIISTLCKENKTTIIMVTHDWSSAYYHTNKLLLLNKNVIYFGDPHNGFTDENMVKTFSSITSNHKVTFGIKNV